MVEVIRNSYENEVLAFQQIEKELTKVIGLRQNFSTKLNENTLVKEELDLLKPNAEVFKLVGPVLIASDLEESKLNVGKRIDYISEEIKRIDKQIEDLERKRDEKQQMLEKLQQQLKK